MTANFGLMLGALLLCLVLSAFFSAAETAFATVNRILVKAMKRLRWYFVCWMIMIVC